MANLPITSGILGREVLTWCTSGDLPPGPWHAKFNLSLNLEEAMHRIDDLADLHLCPAIANAIAGRTDTAKDLVMPEGAVGGSILAHDGYTARVLPLYDGISTDLRWQVDLVRRPE